MVKNIDMISVLMEFIVPGKDTKHIAFVRHRVSKESKFSQLFNNHL